MADPKRKLFQTLKNKQINDIGFGANSNASTERLINKDGSFNVERKGLSIQAPYRMLVHMSWKRFFIVIFFGYILVNGFFALLFTTIGPDSFSGINAGPFYKVFTEAFFFSTQTFTTLGYGVVSPQGLIANMIASIDALIGLMAFALATGSSPSLKDTTKLIRKIFSPRDLILQMN